MIAVLSSDAAARVVVRLVECPTYYVGGYLTVYYVLVRTLHIYSALKWIWVPQ